MLFIDKNKFVEVCESVSGLVHYFGDELNIVYDIDKVSAFDIVKQVYDAVLNEYDEDFTDFLNSVNFVKFNSTVVRIVGVNVDGYDDLYVVSDDEEASEDFEYDLSEEAFYDEDIETEEELDFSHIVNSVDFVEPTSITESQYRIGGYFDIIRDVFDSRPGITNQEVANMFGISKGIVSKIHNGNKKTVVTANTLESIKNSI